MNYSQAQQQRDMRVLDRCERQNECFFTVMGEVDARTTLKHTTRLAPEKADSRPALSPCPSMPGIAGMQMKKLFYFEQLRTVQWYRRRDEILARDKHTCQCCGDTKCRLQVHHKQYIRGRMAWEYDDADLVTLCRPCHDEAGDQTAAMHALLSSLEPTGRRTVEQATGLLAGWAQGEGVDLSLHFTDSPDLFVLGEIVGCLDRTGLNIHVVMSLLDGLRSVDSKAELEARIAVFADSLTKPAPGLVITPRTRFEG